MQVTQYDFDNAITALFEMDATSAKDLLPRHLHPMELMHGVGIFSLTAFHFTDSLVGEYDEVVLSVVTPPVVSHNGKWPRSAFFPFIVGTSSQASRLHAIERWHLSHYMQDIAVDFSIDADKVALRIHESGKPIIDASLSAHQRSEVNHLYQLFTADDDNGYQVDIQMIGTFSEHEEETGKISIHPHPMTNSLLTANVSSYPFRELWMQNGVQRFDEMVRI